MSSLEDFKMQLAAFISEQSGQPCTIEQVLPLAGGASRESAAIVARVGDVVERFVMRRDYPTQMNESALTRAQEFAMMRAAYEHGIQVARVRWYCDNPAQYGLERPFFLMDFVAGESVGRKVISAAELAPAREKLPEQMAEQLAKIHTLDPEPLYFLKQPRGGDPIEESVASTYELIDSLGVHVPAFEFALRWADQHRPSCERVTFVHGDFRLGNLLVDQDGLAAVIDWEFAHVGDPCEEFGYMCMRDWRFGNDHLRMSGLCDRERFLHAYEQYSGVSVDRAAVDWWENMGNIRWGIICLSQAERHLSGRDPSVELASLGRRSAEMQIEALRLIEKAGI